jgi:exodeoxyribonuclease VII small subunit
MSDAPTYETATARLDEIIRRLDSGEAGLRETLDLCQEGRTLVEFCAGELEAVGQGLQELRLDELVARLEQGAAGASAAGASAAGANAAGSPVPGEAAGR